MWTAHLRAHNQGQISTTRWEGNTFTDRHTTGTGRIRENPVLNLTTDEGRDAKMNKTYSMAQRLAGEIRNVHRWPIQGKCLLNLHCIFQSTHFCLSLLLPLFHPTLHDSLLNDLFLLLPLKCILQSVARGSFKMQIRLRHPTGLKILLWL